LTTKEQKPELYAEKGIGRYININSTTQNGPAPQTIEASNGLVEEDGESEAAGLMMKNLEPLIRIL